jgi:hypothetical protein
VRGGPSLTSGGSVVAEVEFEVYRIEDEVHMVLYEADDAAYLSLSPVEAEALGQRLVQKAQQPYNDEEISP